MAEATADGIQEVEGSEAEGQEKQGVSFFQESREQVREFLQKNKGYQTLSMIMLSAAIALLVVLWLWSQAADYHPLYGNQELYEVASIVEVLEREGVNYKLHPESGQVMVDAGQISQARMKLSIAGIQARSPEGLDALDHQELGASQFMEGVRYLRGLEGELAQTIISLKSVRNARVHLAIPKQSSFIRRKEKPSASIFVNLFPGYRLSVEQVEGIINLVATSVANMSRADISVVDQSGRLLSTEALEKSGALGEVSRQFDFKQEVEARYQARISHLLEPLVGPGNFRAQVTASVDFEKVVQTVEQYDPATAVLRSEQGKEQKSIGGAAIGVPGTLSNQPPADTDENEEAESNSKSEFVRNYEVDKVTRQVSNHQGRIEKLSIAVVFNNKAEDAISGSVADWDQARLESMRQMIIDATGLDQARGDQISIHSAPFVPVEGAPDSTLDWWQQPQTLYYVKYGCGTLLAILVLFFLVRPMMQQVTVNLGPPKEQMLPALAEDGSAALSHHMEGEDPEKRRAMFDESFQLLPPELADFETQVTHMRKLSMKQPERVAQVVQLWMSTHES